RLGARVPGTHADHLLRLAQSRAGHTRRSAAVRLQGPRSAPRSGHERAGGILARQPTRGTAGLSIHPSLVTEPAPPPLPNCYWALPGELLAGEHPSGASAEETRMRLGRLLAAGIECFIDLTFPGEAPAYDIALPIGVEYLRKPIKDHGLPELPEHMREILD